jgi:hypothetical protein
MPSRSLIAGREGKMTAHAEAALVNALMASDLTVKDVWVRYLGLGGHRTRQELQDYLSGESEWTTTDRDLLRQALTEHQALSSSRDDDTES